jgi:hypothetical protein
MLSVRITSDDWQALCRLFGYGTAAASEKDPSYSEQILSLFDRIVHANPQLRDRILRSLT